MASEWAAGQRRELPRLGDPFGQGSAPRSQAPDRSIDAGSALRLPAEQRLSGPLLLGIAVMTGLVAIALGAWAFAARTARTTTLTNTVTVDRSPPGVQRAISLLMSPRTQRLPLVHSAGRIVLVAGEHGRAVLVIAGLGPAKPGSSYQAWVTPPGRTARISAAVFVGDEPVVPLQPIVSHGAVVAVTLERAGGVSAPSRVPNLFARRP